MASEILEEWIRIVQDGIEVLQQARTNLDEVRDTEHADDIQTAITALEQAATTLESCHNSEWAADIPDAVQALEQAKTYLDNLRLADRTGEIQEAVNTLEQALPNLESMRGEAHPIPDWEIAQAVSPLRDCQYLQMWVQNQPYSLEALEEELRTRDEEETAYSEGGDEQSSSAPSWWG